MNRIRILSYADEFSQDTKKIFGINETAKLFIKKKINEESSKFKKIQLANGKPDF
jgi:hypothetical protein